MIFKKKNKSVSSRSFFSYFPFPSPHFSIKTPGGASGIIFVALILLWSVFVFFQYINNHDTQFDSVIIAFKLFDTAIPQMALMGALALLAYAVGRTFIARTLKVEIEADWDFIFSSALGFMILSFGAMFITMAQILSKISVFIFLGLLILYSYKEIIGTIRRLRMPELKFSSPFETSLFFLIIIAAGINLILALAPPFGLDEQQYHLNAPLHYIRHGGFYILSHLGGQTRYPQNMEMLFTLGMVVKDDILAKLINYYFGIMTLFLIRAIMKRFFKAGSLLPCAIFYCSWLVYYVSAQIHVELPLAFYEGTALFALLLWLEGWHLMPGADSNRMCFHFYLSAACAGFALGIKYTSMLSLLAFFILIIIYYKTEELKLIRVLLSFILRYGLVALLLFSPWMIKNTVYYRNPIEPFRIRQLTAYLNDLAGRKPAAPVSAISPEFARRSQVLNRAVYPHSSLREFLMVPYNSTIYGEWGRQVFDMLISPFYLMFLPFLFVMRRKGWGVNALLIYVSIFYVQWLVLQPITRYLAAIMPMMAILIAFLFQRLEAERDQMARIFTNILKGIVVFMLFVIMMCSLLTLVWRNPVFYLMGRESKSAFLARNSPGGIQHLIDQANKELPADAKILLLWEKRGYYLQRQYVEDSFGFLFVKLMYLHKDPARVAEELKNLGFTHILCDTYIPRGWFGSSYKEEQKNKEAKAFGEKEYGFLMKMVEEQHLELLGENTTLFLYKIQ